MSAKRQSSAADSFIGSRVRARRMELKLSQSALADALGLTFQQVQKYEKGTNRIGSGRLMDIAKALDVPESYFFEGARAKGKALAKGDKDLSRVLTMRTGVKLVEGFLALSEDNQEAVTAFVAKLAKSGES